MVLAEIGTHGVLDARLGGYRDGERSLAYPLASSTGPGDLVIADRGFWSVEFAHVFTAAGTDLLVRLQSNHLGSAQEQLPDGSYLSLARPGKDVRLRAAREGRTLPEHVIYRVITFAKGDKVAYLGTTLLDPEQYPAAELVVLYRERWEIELAFDEIKNHLRSNRWTSAGTVLCWARLSASIAGPRSPSSSSSGPTGITAGRRMSRPARAAARSPVCGFRSTSTRPASGPRRQPSSERMQADGAGVGGYCGDGARFPLSTGLPARRLLFGFVVWLWAQRPGWTVSRLARVLRTGQRFGFLIARGQSRLRRAGRRRARASHRASVKERVSLVAVAPSWDGMLRRTMRTHFK